MSDRYHHGDLPNALRCAAADVIAERGVGGFTLREVARRAGVSHAAPAHHFGDSRGLLTSLAVEAFDQLASRTRAASEEHDDPAERLVAIGRAYVQTAVEHPAHCQVVFRLDVVDSDDPEYKEAGARAYAVLEAAVRAFTVRYAPTLDVVDGSNLCWSSMQGLVTLYPNIVRLDGDRGRRTAAIDDMAARFSTMILDGLRGTGAQRSS